MSCPKAGMRSEMLSVRLRIGGIEVRRARQSIHGRRKTYEAGTWVIPAGQAFRGYLVDLMEPQALSRVAGRDHRSHEAAL